MKWDIVQKRWVVHFVDVQKQKHDVLYLSFFSPTAMHTFLYDHAVRETTSTTLAFDAVCNEPCIRTAEAVLVKKLAKWHGLTYLCRVDFADGDYERVVDIGVDNGAWDEFDPNVTETEAAAMRRDVATSDSEMDGAEDDSDLEPQSEGGED